MVQRVLQDGQMQRRRHERNPKHDNEPKQNQEVAGGQAEPQGGGQKGEGKDKGPKGDGKGEGGDDVEKKKDMERAEQVKRDKEVKLAQERAAKKAANEVRRLEILQELKDMGEPEDDDEGEINWGNAPPENNASESHAGDRQA